MIDFGFPGTSSWYHCGANEMFPSKYCIIRPWSYGLVNETPCCCCLTPKSFGSLHHLSARSFRPAKSTKEG